MGVMVGRGWAEEIMCRRTAAVAISRPKLIIGPMHVCMWMGVWWRMNWMRWGMRGMWGRMRGMRFIVAVMVVSR